MIEDAKLWYPWTHGSEPGYMYTMNVVIKHEDKILDEYSQRFGIRTVRVNGTKFLLNGEEFYFTGFGEFWG